MPFQDAKEVSYARVSHTRASASLFLFADANSSEDSGNPICSRPVHELGRTAFRSRLRQAR